MDSFVEIQLPAHQAKVIMDNDTIMLGFSQHTQVAALIFELIKMRIST